AKASVNSGNPNVKLLFHATSDPTHILGRGLGGIAAGFDSATAGAYGPGVYFASAAAYPVFIHPRRENQDGSFTFIIAEVALGDVCDKGDALDNMLTSPKKRQEKL